VREAYRVLLGKSEGKRPIARPRRRWEDKIKIFRKWGGWGIDRIYLAQDRDRCLALVNAVINLRVSLNTDNFLTT